MTLKATTLEAAKFALQNSKNIYWILADYQKTETKLI